MIYELYKHQCYSTKKRIVPCIDEFGGYSSRLRIPELENAAAKPRNVKAKSQAQVKQPSEIKTIYGD